MTNEQIKRHIIRWGLMCEQNLKLAHFYRHVGDLTNATRRDQAARNQAAYALYVAKELVY